MNNSAFGQGWGTKKLVVSLVAALIVLVCFTLLGCGETSPYPKTDTVQQAWDEMMYAWKYEDADRLYHILCEEFKSKVSPEDAGVVFKQLESMGATEDVYDLFKVTDIREEGDTAYVDFVVEGYEDYPSEYIFVKENGEWKLKQ